MPDDTLQDLLNRTSQQVFVERLGAIYEHSPWVAERAWLRRPFADHAALARAMREVVAEASAAEQLALIRAHPDLAGRLARAGTLQAHSTAEQKGLGLDRLPDDQYERFDRLNTLYRARFGFPFIIAARDHTRDSVLDAFERRLGHTADQEREAALGQIDRIAWFRLQAMADAPG